MTITAKYINPPTVDKLAASCTLITLGPACVNLAGIRAGDRNLLRVTLTRNGAPVDLTGLTVEAQARKTAVDPDPPALTADTAIVDAPGGVVEVRWPGEAVRALLGTAASWSGVWDMQVGSTGDDPVTFVAGTFAATQDVTR